MTIHIGICDDEEYYIDQLKKCVKEYEKESNITVEIFIYHSGSELLNDIEEKKKNLDVVFMDIDMPEINGIETVKRMRAINNRLIICFVTGYENYSFSAFQVDALGYTLKPAKYQDIAHFMEKALLFLQTEKEQKDNESRYIQVNIKKEMMIIDIDKIIYIEKQRNQCLLICENMQVSCYETLEHLYQQLDPERFLYTNQGFIVNLTKVKEVTKSMVYLSDAMKVPVSRSKYKGVHDKYINRLMNKQRMKSTGSSLI